MEFRLEDARPQFYCQLEMADGPQPAPVCLFARIQSTSSDIVESVSRRLKLEYTAGAGEPPPDLLDEDYPDARWISLGTGFSPESLPGLASHAVRVASLYRDAEGHPKIEIEVGYADHFRVIRACCSDLPHRQFLGSGIWGELACAWSNSGKFAPWAHSPAPWKTPEAVAFLAAASEASKKSGGAPAAAESSNVRV